MSSTEVLDASLSIIVVALNEERRLPFLLKSIEEQMSNSMLKEIILVDNGSCDNTLTIMKAFEKKHSICSVFQNTMCLSEVYDFATRIASGTYISYLDADMALPLGWFDTVEKLVKTYGRYCAGFVARLLPLQRYHGPLNRFLMAYFLGDTARDGFWKEKTFHSGGLVIRREVAQRIGFRKNLPSSHDGDFSFRFLNQGYKACYFPSRYFVFDEQYYTLYGLLSYYRKMGISQIILMRVTRDLGIVLSFVRSLLEPLLPHYLVTRYKKASMLSEVKFGEWVFYGLARIVAILTSVLQYGLLGFPLPSKVLRRKV